MKRTILLLSIACFGCGSSTPTCDATTCPTGCCDSNGACRPGTAQSACGKDGASCAACSSTQSCRVGVCDPPAGVDAGFDAGTVSVGAAVVNEICARGGNEYVELYNPGSGVKDLSHYGLADTAPDAGPYVSRALRFGAGVSLASHAFLLVMVGRNDAGPTTDCLDAGVGCFEATWSVSNSNGETVWLLDAEDNVEEQTHYPANGHDAGRSYGRIPDGTGDFEETARTPGRANTL